MNIIDSKLVFKKDKLLIRRMTEAIVLHHSCSRGQTVQQIHREHLGRGWNGIGYHYYIRRDGSVYSGRPQFAVGSHCQGYNKDTIGVCFEGDFRKDKITREQIVAGKELIEYLNSSYKKKLKLFNHGELNATMCPVINLREILTNGNY